MLYIFGQAEGAAHAQMVLQPRRDLVEGGDDEITLIIETQIQSGGEVAAPQALESMDDGHQVACRCAREEEGETGDH